MVRCGHGVVFVLIALSLTGCGSLATVLLSEGEDGLQTGTSGSFTVDNGPDGNPNVATSTDEQDSTVKPGGADETSPADYSTDPPLIISTPGGQPVDPSLLDSTEPVGPIESSVFDPLGATLGDAALMGELLPFLLDGLLIDMLDPAGNSSSGNAASFTYLELLCRDEGLPETYCRRRYAE